MSEAHMNRIFRVVADCREYSNCVNMDIWTKTIFVQSKTKSQPTSQFFNLCKVPDSLAGDILTFCV